MLLLKLSPSQIEMFTGEPEAGMGFQFAAVGERVGFILSGRVLTLSEAEDDGPYSAALANRLWFGADARYRVDARAALASVIIAEEEQLIEALTPAPGPTRYVSTADPLGMGFILNTPGYLPPTPPRPSSIYGHLPFTGITQAGDVFYRCEHWATSRRVRHATNDILSGTYGFPASELPFVPTGFAAVGRYALPDLPPACRRYEITPPPGYSLHCGAAVPLYGQAGGGVEVMFPRQFANTGKLPPATVLLPL